MADGSTMESRVLIRAAGHHPRLRSAITDRPDGTVFGTRRVGGEDRLPPFKGRPAMALGQEGVQGGAQILRGEQPAGDRGAWASACWTPPLR